MRWNRILSYLNYLIALALVAAAGAGFWYAYRPQAQTSGAEAAGVSAEVQIARDSLGVPHITAKSLDDLFFAQGYVHAQDRLFQLDLTRRQASGELSEVFGTATLQSDIDARRLQLRRVAEMHAGSLSTEDRAAMAAYARGINHFIETHLDRLPLEFTLLGYSPAPWTITDCMLTAVNMARSLTESWQQEVAKQTLLANGDAKLVEYLFPTRSGGEPQVGSNAWAVSGRFTASGKPLLANDPHLALSLPGVWYENDLRAPGFHVAGVSLPGLPTVIIGHNDSIAWGMTNLQFDVQDLYLERADLNLGVAIFNGVPEPLAKVTETVRVRGGGIATLAVGSTRHGPIITESTQLSRNAPYQLALHWKVAEPGGLGFALLALNRAANWDQFRTALRGWTAPAQNFVYADTAGNIGYQVAGSLPKRPSHTGDVPVEGFNGKFEWDGTIPFDELPSVYNPPSGRVITANQNPFPADYPYRVNGTFAPPDRARQIEARLAGKPKLGTGDMLHLQRDLYSAFHYFLASQLVAAAKDRTGADPKLAEGVRLLSAWDGQMSAASPAAMIATLAWQNLRQAVVERAAPGKSALYDFPMATSAVERLLRERPAGWFQSYDELLLRALMDAIKQGDKEQGRTVADWRLGQHQSLTLISPVFAQARVLGINLSKWLPARIGPAEMGGASTTVNQHTTRAGQVIAPSLRMVVDLANLDNSVLNLTTGQSGQLFSGHYRDQWDAYSGGTSFPLQFNKVDAPSVLGLTPR